MLEADRLSKSYGGRRVVDGLSLRCDAGSVLGLLGPNGAGKTTTLRMLYGLIEPDEGTIRYDGKDFADHRTELKRHIGVCTQEDTVDYDFTVHQNLLVYASYFRPRVEHAKERADELIERFGLGEYRDYTPHQLSGGYKRRLLIARSVVHRPRVLFLDEPTTGLDPKARVALWELVAGMREEGLAIILTTHYMDEAERLSDRLLVMSRGRDVAHGPPSAVVGEVLGEHVLVVPADCAERADILAWIAQEGAKQPSTVLGELRLPLATEQLSRFTDRFAGCRFQVRAPNLDDLFLQLSEPAEQDREAAE